MDERTTLSAVAADFYQRGWMAGTAGNLSARNDDGEVWITASGCHKGRLTTADFVKIALPDTDNLTEFESIELLDRRPSAETSIHAVIYRLFPTARACYHVHSVPANLASNLCGDRDLDLPPLEMIKGLGLWVENPQVRMPVFANHLNVSNIAAEIAVRFQSHPPAIPALLIRNHGVTVWGETLDLALHHLEIAEFIFQYIIAAKAVGQ